MSTSPAIIGATCWCCPGGGFDGNRKLTEVDEVNFAPHVTMPMPGANGRYDTIPPHDQTIKEVLDWLDRYQRQVK